MDLPDYLIRLQRSADEEGRKLEHLDDEERDAQRRVWFTAAAEAHAAVADWALDHDLDHFDVEKALRQQARHPEPGGG